MTPKPAKNTREILDSIFYESTMVTELQLKPKLEKPAKTDKEHSGPDRKPVDSKKDEILGILKTMGIKDVADRLTLDDDGAFRLRSSQTQHKDDSDLLFDLTKIDPLVIKGYVTVDAESDDKGFSILIISGDSLPALDLPNPDDLEAVKFDNGKKEALASIDQAKINQLAEELVNKVKQG